jgi:hypothetical protein
LHPHRRALVPRAVAAAAVVTMAATAAFVPPASADHAAGHEEECRGYPSYPSSPNPWLKIVAEDNKFDADCLQAPANRKFRIYLQNNDADPHNISIYSADPGDGKAEQLYKGRAVKGPGQEEYAIDELPPGKYYFQDDKVPDMNGKVQIDKPKK